jgi:hypothetical protein
MAAGMTIPMAAWMLYRGMGRKNTAEMAAAMVLPKASNSSSYGLGRSPDTVTAAWPTRMKES